MITLGAVASAHGVHGQFKVKPFTVVPSDVAAYGPVRLEDGRVLQLTVKSVVKNLVICEANGITDRGMAESLRGQTLSVDRAALPDLDETHTYHADLIGLGVQDTAGQQLGIVVGLYEFGAGEIVEISLAGSNKTELYPFYPPFLVDLNILEGKIVLAEQPASDDKGPDNRVDGDD
ncbi:MAG: 16S rRNA processing protein RimM [Rhodospirillaceae bacterium]|nr:16S rRNA processing protein RimM [Rhodospirillaceae bacterium]|tara:strand:- start:241 stop:768 length:528 start_codon:yes stop_codon:yes gene_type:complete